MARKEVQNFVARSWRTKRTGGRAPSIPSSVVRAVSRDRHLPCIQVQKEQHVMGNAAASGEHFHGEEIHS